jgi:hypothetical protein
MGLMLADRGAARVRRSARRLRRPVHRWDTPAARGRAGGVRVEPARAAAERVASAWTPLGTLPDMFVTNHTMAGGLFGTAAHRRPFLAYAAGVASHLAMDALPHWGAEGDDDIWMRAARRDGLLALAVLAALAAAAPRGSRVGVLAGAAGAITPDLRSPLRVAFDVQPLPDALDEVHTDVQQGKEAGGHLPIELAAAAVLASALGLALGRLRRRTS